MPDRYQLYHLFRSYKSAPKFKHFPTWIIFAQESKVEVNNKVTQHLHTPFHSKLFLAKTFFSLEIRNLFTIMNVRAINRFD